MTVPLTYGCPWRCAYCGYRRDGAGLITEEEFQRCLHVARSSGASEMLFLSGEIPDTLPRVREELRARGLGSFLDFAVQCMRRALDAGLLPHTNIGALSEAQLSQLREVNVSMGLMIENVDEAFNATVAPEKSLAGRLKTIEAAGRLRIPFTSGILIGLGESRESRFKSLDALASSHARWGHLQEIILQNFVPNASSQCTGVELELRDYVELIEHWRAIAPDVAVQLPPNLNAYWRELLPLIDDLGGISPDGDLVNPLNPWQQVDSYRTALNSVGCELEERLPIYPRFLTSEWVAPGLRARLGIATTPRAKLPSHCPWERPLEELRAEATALTLQLHGRQRTFVINRNANFTNICNVGCAFCGFQRRASASDAYTRTPEEIVERLASTPEITEVCMQGGINPGLSFDYYLDLVRTIRAYRGDLHIHAFSPMEIFSLHEKTSLGVELILGRLQEAGLNTMPGTAAEILDDAVRAQIASRKLGTEQWCQIIRTAHRLGIRSTATILYGHVEEWSHIRRHFERLLAIQEETGGFTEFIPLQFVADENPLGHRIRPNPIEVMAKQERLYPLARLFFGNALPHLQTSWVKLGLERAAQMLDVCDDLGGTLYEESITRSSGGQHGQVRTAEALSRAISQGGWLPLQRTTLYHVVSEVRGLN